MTLATWMPIYWGDYSRDTGHLNALAHGAYLMLIKHYWCTARPLVNDDDELWRVACCDSKKEWLKLKPKVARFFTVKDGALHHKRIDAEIAAASANSEKKRSAAHARWGKRSSESDAPADADADADADANGDAGAHANADFRICPSPSPSPSPSPKAAKPLVIQSPREAPSAENGHNGEENGREVVGGHFWDAVWPMIVDTARIDLTRWMGNEIPARKWLRDRIEPDTIVAVIRKIASRADYQPPATLAYFEKPIREAHAKAAP